jgi:hypothetical protein
MRVKGNCALSLVAEDSPDAVWEIGKAEGFAKTGNLPDAVWGMMRELRSGYNR